MINSDLNKIINALLLVGIILCGIAQMLPWGRLELPINEEPQNELPTEDFTNIIVSVDFYHWGGMHISPKFPGVPEWHFTPTNFSGISNSPKLFGFAFGTLFLYFAIPLAIISLIIGVIAYKKIGRKRSKNSLQAGIFSMLAVISFSFYMQLTYLMNIEDIEGLSANYYWYFGFYLMIISTILFFISFFIIRRTSTKEENIRISEKESIIEGTKQNFK